MMHLLFNRQYKNVHFVFLPILQFVRLSQQKKCCRIGKHTFYGYM